MQLLPGVVLLLRNKKAKLMLYWDAHIVVALVGISSLSGNLLSRLTTTYFQVLLILFIAYISFSLLSVLLSTCSSVIEDTHTYCPHVSHNCLSNHLSIDVYLSILICDFLIFDFMFFNLILISLLHYLTNMLPISLYYLSMFLSFMYAFVILH